MGKDFMGFGYVDDGKAIIKELICKEEIKAFAVSSIASSMGCEKALLLEAAHEGHKYIAVDGESFCSDCTWNISFD